MKHRYEVISQDDIVIASADLRADALIAAQNHANRGIAFSAYVFDTQTRKVISA